MTHDRERDRRTSRRTDPSGSVDDSAQRALDEMLAEGVRRAGSEPVLESLSDMELLAECDRLLPESLQVDLSDLLEENRERTLDEMESRRLADLIRAYP